MYRAYVPLVLAAHLDQGLFRRSDRGVRRLARHGRLGKELRSEVLHGDRIMITI
jgi:hypothetical protein